MDNCDKCGSEKTRKIGEAFTVCDSCQFLFEATSLKEKEAPMSSPVQRGVLFRAGESDVSKACNAFGEALEQMKEDCPEEFQSLIDKGLIKINQKK